MFMNKFKIIRSRNDLCIEYELKVITGSIGKVINWNKDFHDETSFSKIEFTILMQKRLKRINNYMMSYMNKSNKVMA